MSIEMALMKIRHVINVLEQEQGEEDTWGFEISYLEDAIKEIETDKRN